MRQQGAASASQHFWEVIPKSRLSPVKKPGHWSEGVDGEGLQFLCPPAVKARSCVFLSFLHDLVQCALINVRKCGFMHVFMNVRPNNLQHLKGLIVASVDPKNGIPLFIETLQSLVRLVDEIPKVVLHQVRGLIMKSIPKMMKHMTAAPLGGPLHLLFPGFDTAEFDLFCVQFNLCNNPVLGTLDVNQCDFVNRRPNKGSLSSKSPCMIFLAVLSVTNQS